MKLTIKSTVSLLVFSILAYSLPSLSAPKLQKLPFEKTQPETVSIPQKKIIKDLAITKMRMRRSSCVVNVTIKNIGNTKLNLTSHQALQWYKNGAGDSGWSFTPAQRQSLSNPGGSIEMYLNNPINGTEAVKAELLRTEGFSDNDSSNNVITRRLTCAK